MRNVFLVLVLANLGFAAWHTWYAEEPATTLRISSVPSIALIGDRDGGSVTADSFAEPSAPVSPLSGSPQSFSSPVDAPFDGCISVGPLADSVADEAQAALAQSGFAIGRRESVDQVWVGQWVYIDQIPTQTRANQILNTLHEAGISEAYVIAGTDSGNLVSLGIFRETSRAQQRLDEARELGYEPVVSDRFQSGDSSWLDVRADGQTMAEFLGILEALPGATTLQQSACVPP